MHQMHKKFGRSYASLEEIFEFTDVFFADAKIEPSVRFPVHFVMEELFTNMVKYNPDNENEILLKVASNNGEVIVSLTDYDVDDFDVTAERHVDVEAPLDERTPGGLGILLIQKMVDSLEYDYADRQSTVTFTKGPE